MLYFILLSFIGMVFSVSINTNINIANENMAATSLINKGIILFAGGLGRFLTGTDINVKQVDIYNITTNQWTTAELSLGRYELSATSLETKGLAFFAGGAYVPNGDYTKPSILVDVIDVYNVNTNSWTTARMSVNRSGVACTSLDKQNLVFFAGGYISIANGYPEFTTNVIDIWNITSNTWTTSTLHIKNMFIFATSLNNYGLAFMGGGFQKKLSIYNANTNSWSTADLSVETNYGASTSLESYGLAFFAGGATQNNVFSNIIDIYDAKTDSWSKMFLSSARAGVSAASLDKYGLVFFAGGGDTQTQTNVVDILDVKTMTITTSYLLNRRAIIASTQLSELAFFGGGYSSTEQVTGIDIFSYCTKSITTINPFICTECPAGSFCNYQVIPITCPTGSYCGINVSVPTPCPAGTYNDVTGKAQISDCKKCPLGTYNSNLGASSQTNCLACQPGTYCSEGSIFSQACPENYYCPNPSTKITCPAGTYLDETFATSVLKCKKCLKGHYCDGKGNAPIPCAPGTFSKDEGSSKCEICPGGYSCTFGGVEPTICEMNYIAKKGSSACTACPSSTYTESSGSSDCIPCTGNQFDVSGWWCMSTTDKILFVSVWGGTALSILATLKKIYEFIVKRKQQIYEAGLPFTIKTFLFSRNLDSVIPTHNTNMGERQVKVINRQLERVRNEFELTPPLQSRNFVRHNRYYGNDRAKHTQPQKEEDGVMKHYSWDEYDNSSDSDFTKLKKNKEYHSYVLDKFVKQQENNSLQQENQEYYQYPEDEINNTEKEQNLDLNNNDLSIDNVHKSTVFANNQSIKNQNSQSIRNQNSQRRLQSSVRKITMLTNTIPRKSDLLKRKDGSSIT